MRRSAPTVLLSVIGTVLVLGSIALLRARPADLPAVLNALGVLIRALSPLP
ncbi:hypothetical protein ACFO3J_24880 [Streptomyces polygonati]|uniref:Secreted protein n=1 Tax=Streptomyces polygonati TaxID=1617087 RepID=A0ABV8HXV0_9ACTN